MAALLSNSASVLQDYAALLMISGCHVARNTPPVEGAQWTGIVTQIAMEMLESGKVEAVVCVQSQEQDRFAPMPVSSISTAIGRHYGCFQDGFIVLRRAFHRSPLLKQGIW